MSWLSEEQLLARCEELQKDTIDFQIQAERIKSDLDDISARIWKRILIIITEGKRIPEEEAFEALKTSVPPAFITYSSERTAGMSEEFRNVEMWLESISVASTSSVLGTYVGMGKYSDVALQPDVADLRAARFKIIEEYINETRRAALQGPPTNSIAIDLHPDVAEIRNCVSEMEDHIPLLQEKNLLETVHNWKSRIGRAGISMYILAAAARSGEETLEDYKNKKGKGEMTGLEELRRSAQQFATGRFFVARQESHLLYLCGHLTRVGELAYILWPDRGYIPRGHYAEPIILTFLENMIREQRHGAQMEADALKYVSTEGDPSYEEMRNLHGEQVSRAIQIERETARKAVEEFKEHTAYQK